MSYNGSLFRGYTVNIYEGDAVVPTYTMFTDRYGMVVARLTEGTRYRLSLHTGDGVNLITDAEDRYIYPRIEGIQITIGEYTGTPTNYTTPTNRTNVTDRHGTQGGGISAMNTSYLTSNAGIGALGQGVLTSMIVWIVYGAGGPLTVLFTTAILAWLGIITWAMLFLFLMTGISIYVLKEM